MSDATASAQEQVTAAAEPSTRLAVAADNARLCELFKSVTMDAALHLAVERDPDFFALYDIERGDRRVVVWEVDGAIEGVGTLLARDGYLGGRRMRLGYLGDLRFSPKIRGGQVLGTSFGPLFRESCRELGCEVALTAVIASNQAAMSALVKRSPRYPEKPFYAPLRTFKILSVQFTLGKEPRPTDLAVSRAEDKDLAAVADLLGEDHRARPFGYAVDEGLLRERLRRWPGLAAESFYLARDRAGRLRGVTAVWDAGPIKRYRVLGYRGAMRYVKLGYNAFARLAGMTPLPPPGGLLRYFYLTHLSVKDDDPAVMAALLDRIYADHRGRGYHFFTAPVLEGDPLAPAYERFRTRSLPAALFAVSAPGSPYNTADLGPGRPGIEMALV